MASGGGRRTAVRSVLGTLFLLGCGIEPPPSESSSTAPVLVESDGCAMVVPVTRPRSDVHALEARLCPQQQVLYLNFNGQSGVGAAQDNPATGASTVVYTTTGLGSRYTIPPFRGSASDRARIIQRFRTHFAPFSIDIVDTRPSGTDYT